MTRPPQSSPLFPYTPLSLSVPADLHDRRVRRPLEHLCFRHDSCQLLVASCRLPAETVDDRLTGNWQPDRKSTRLNSSHLVISYAVFCLKKKTSTSSMLAAST